MTKRKKSSAPRTREPKANQDAASTKAPSAEESATNQAAPESTKSPQSAEVPLATGPVADSEATIVSAPAAIGATPGDDDAIGEAPHSEDEAIGEAPHSEDEAIGEPAPDDDDGLEDTETTVNLVGELPLPGRDHLDDPTARVAGEALEDVDSLIVQRAHLRGLLEALIFASDTPIKPNELAKLASAPVKQVRELLGELRNEYCAARRPPRRSRRRLGLPDERAVRAVHPRPHEAEARSPDAGAGRDARDHRLPSTDHAPRGRRCSRRRQRTGPQGPARARSRAHPRQARRARSSAHLRDDDAFSRVLRTEVAENLPTLREFTELTEESRATYEDELGEPPNITGPAAASPTDDEGQPSRDSMSVPKGTHEHGEHDEHDEHDAPGAGEAERHDDEAHEASGDEAHEPGPAQDPLDDEALARDDGPTIASDAFAPPPSEEEEKPPPSSPDATDDERDERDATDDDERD